MATKPSKRMAEDVAEPGPSKRHKPDKDTAAETGGCDTCHTQKSKYSLGSRGVVITEDLITLLTKKGKNAKTAKKPSQLDTFFQAINAFLNTQEVGDAEVFIHTQNPHLLGEFDKKVDDKLIKLIPDDSLYDEFYERDIYDKNHVVYKVKLRKSNRPPSTEDFCTKVSVNKGIVDPTHAQIKRFLETVSDSGRRTDGRGKTLPTFLTGRPLEVPAKSQQSTDRVPFQESYNIQAKPAKNKKVSIDEQIRIWWEEHNLPHYITAFAKLPGGGSILLGVKEDVSENGNQTGRFICQGLILGEQDRESVRDGILNKVRNIKWSTFTEGKWSTSTEGVVNVEFHEVQNGEQDECVVEIIVENFRGLSFYNNGPRSYELRNNNPTVYTMKKWQDLMSKK